MNKKICDDSTKRNSVTAFFSEGISRILHSLPHMVEDNVDSVNLLLSGNAIQNVFSLIVDKVCSMRTLPVIETPKKNLGPDFVEVSHVLDMFCFIYIYVESR